MAISKQNFLVLIAGLFLTGLLLFSLISRDRLENRIDQVETFRKTLIEPLLEARTSFATLGMEADPATLEKEIVSPLEIVRKSLVDLYEGKENETVPSVQGSERMIFSIKLVLMEIERTQQAIKAKVSGADFDRTIQELDKIAGEFEKQNEFSHRLTEWVSWLTAAIAFFIFAGMVIAKYVLEGREREQTKVLEISLGKEKKRVKTLSGFIEAMANGNYDIEIESDKNDELSTTLLTMRDKLKGNAEEDKRRNWATSGLAQIGEILRATTGTSSDLYDSIVRFVVKYTKSNQGGLFITLDNDADSSTLELVACYAFERKKFLTKQVDIGQGLVGQCFLEKERIHLREVPNDYVRITSGLGGENPSSCLLVPLKVNEKVFGVLELASFSHYEEFEIELVEKFAETIAATISSVQINESTRFLLERTQQQAEEMKSQEEEMRQNMEELSATQEEMQRKEGEYIQRIQELEEQQAAVAR